ncbi:hypothetical protein LBMAG42_55350 [Deltaproteobacteria bacterium]|nr:hypothetical protein LBMAG42_55350 [Deltaproteobacteria bacterium]
MISDFLRHGGRVVLLRDGEQAPALVDAVLRLFRCFPGPFRVEVASVNAELPATAPAEWEALFGEVQRVRREQGGLGDAFVGLLTPKPNECNWFSAVDPEDPRSFFVHTEDWAWITSAPTACLVAYEVIENVLEGALAECGVAMETIAHPTPVGCLNDMCVQKMDFHLKVRTGDICGECVERLVAHGASPELLRQVVAVLDACRRESIATGRFAPTTADYATWPFPVAVTRHKALVARDPLLRFLLLLDHFDALVRHLCITRACRDGAPLNIPEAPSLGWWSRTLQHDSATIGDVVAASEQRAVVDLRNELRAHGYVQHGPARFEAASAAVERGLDQLHRVLEERESGWELRLARAIGVNGRYRVSGDRLVGSNTLSPIFEDTLATRADPMTLGVTKVPAVYLHDAASGRYVSLAPYYLLQACGECRHPRLLVVDGRVGPHGARYIDIVVGHRTEITWPAA